MRDIYILGDPHLGRQFIHGVPLHRRGEREHMVWDQFVKELNVEAKIHVCMGDLFDKPFVSYDLIVDTAQVYIKTAQKNPNTTYIIMKGNHDYFRDLTRISAFDLFSLLVTEQLNIHIVDDEVVEYGEFAFVGYSVKYQAEDLWADIMPEVTTVFGHWDVTDYGGDNHNLIPTKRFAELGITRAYTGHIHKADTFERDGVEVVVVGSMQPYAHGEETNDDLYVTLTLEQLNDADPDYLKRRCVRVLGIPDNPVDCLQLTIKRSETADNRIPTATIGDFDFETLFTEAFADVPEDIQEKVRREYDNRRISG